VLDYEYLKKTRPEIAVLIEEGVKVAKVQETAPPEMSMHEAALTGNIEVIRQHIKAGSDLNEKDETGGGSPLHTATTFDKTEVALTLLEAGANINFKNNEGSTPLHTAAFLCRIEIVKALLKNGADVIVRNNAGSTALESVQYPFEAVISVYDYLSQAFGPLGLKLDYEYLKKTRPEIAKLISTNN